MGIEVGKGLGSCVIGKAVGRHRVNIVKSNKVKRFLKRGALVTLEKTLGKRHSFSQFVSGYHSKDQQKGKHQW